MLVNQYISSSIIIKEFTLKNKFVFNNATAHYTFYGEKNNGKKIALFFHGFSGSSELHVWWHKFPLQEVLKNYNIICFNSLGSCHGSLGPETISPNTGLPYAKDFPEICIEDTVNFIVLALQEMNIQKIDLVFGCSLGGMQAFDMYMRFPLIANKFISVCGSPLPLMTKLTNAAQSNILDTGIKNNLPTNILKSYMGLARFFFRLTCTTEKALEILDKKENVEEYFLTDSFNYESSFSPYSYNLYLKMLRNYQIDIFEQLIPDNLKKIILLVSIIDDCFTPPEDIDKIFNQLTKKRHKVKNMQFKTNYGHESWIVDGKRFYEFIKKELIA
ncbi:MAG: alpha/beta fold hydrolase [Proteobacteria bacterium]|nr:alpha/beta fold hydrolase [Pseudomonadota bacterium]